MNTGSAEGDGGSLEDGLQLGVVEAPGGLEGRGVRLRRRRAGDAPACPRAPPASRRTSSGSGSRAIRPIAVALIRQPAEAEEALHVEVGIESLPPSVRVGLTTR